MEQTDTTIDWSRQALVGVLHNEQQLEANLAHRFYHMPLKLLMGSPTQVREVALYQSRRLFKEKAGVHVWGKVVRCTLAPRSEITEIPAGRNPQERYIRFDVECWNTLHPPVRAGGLAPGVSMFTTRYLLEHSKNVAELCIRTPEQYAAHRMVQRASLRSEQNGKPVELPAKPGYRVLVAGKTIGIYTPDGRYEERSLWEFYREPYSFLQRMCAVLNNEIR